MSKFKTNAVYKVTKPAKGQDAELGSLYLTKVPVTFAQVIKPGKKYNSEDKAYSMNIFIDASTMNKLDEIGINKELSEVGVTKIKKGKNRGSIKYPLNEHNENYEGMFAAQFSRDVVKRNAEGEIVKKRTPLKVVDSEGNPFKEEVGNGSVCSVKLFAYRNSDEMLVLMLDTVVVIDHVPYEKADGYYDEELGITIKTSEDKESSNDIDEELISGSDSDDDYVDPDSDSDDGDDGCPF